MKIELCLALTLNSILSCDFACWQGGGIWHFDFSVCSSEISVAVMDVQCSRRNNSHLTSELIQHRVLHWRLVGDVHYQTVSYFLDSLFQCLEIQQIFLNIDHLNVYWALHQLSSILILLTVVCASVIETWMPDYIFGINDSCVQSVLLSHRPGWLARWGGRLGNEDKSGMWLPVQRTLDVVSLFRHAFWELLGSSDVRSH